MTETRASLACLKLQPWKASRSELKESERSRSHVLRGKEKPDVDYCIFNANVFELRSFFNSNLPSAAKHFYHRLTAPLFRVLVH